MPQEESVLRLGRDEALEAARLWQECGDAREFACRVLGGVMNALMDSEAQQMCGAGRNERSDGRENSRNGYRPRSLKTAVGDVELEIPKLRHGTYYPEGMLARWSRVDTSVAALVQEMYVCGVSTRKVEHLVRALGNDTGISRSTVSRICSEIDEAVQEFLHRRIDHTWFPYLFLDATYLDVRHRGHVVSQALVVATGVSGNGRREILGMALGDAETTDFWTEFLRSLRERGLKVATDADPLGVILVTSDAHAGLKAAVKAILPGAVWQRSLVKMGSGGIVPLVHPHRREDIPDGPSGREYVPAVPNARDCLHAAHGSGQTL